MVASRRIILILLLLALLALASAWGVWRISKMLCHQPFGAVVCRVETQDRIVALSFDDGPTGLGVDAVLPLLDAHGAKSTFFLIGEEIQRDPAAARRVVAGGHEVGNHSFSHVRMIGRPMAFYRRELATTDALVRAAGAPTPALVRPPYLQRLWGFTKTVQRAGQQLVTADVLDRMDPDLSPEAYAQHVLDRVQPGSIIVIHAMYPVNAPARAALPDILATLQERGYRMVTVSELLASADPLANGPENGDRANGIPGG